MKIKILNTVIPLIFLAVFNACWFTLIEVNSATRWICYAAIHLSYFLLWVATRSIPGVKGGVVHGYPKIGIAFGYFFIMLILGAVGATINPDKTTWLLTSFVAITGIYLLAYTSLMLAEEHSIDSARRDRRNLHFIRDCSQQLQETMRNTLDADQRKQVEQVYDAIRNAQVTSAAKATAVESQIASKIAEIQATVSDHDRQAPAISDALALIRQRDSLIRMLR